MEDLVKQQRVLAPVSRHSLEATAHPRIVLSRVIQKDQLDAVTLPERVLARSCTMEPNVKIRTALLLVTMVEVVKLIMEPAHVLIHSMAATARLKNVFLLALQMEPQLAIPRLELVLVNMVTGELNAKTRTAHPLA